jgi:hypothetical protein
MLNLLSEDPDIRFSFQDLKKNKWITKNGEFPLPDIHEEALEYVYSLTSKEISVMKEEERESFLDNNVSKIEDEGSS